MEPILEPGWSIAAAAGILGLILGSFLNVCTFRWPAEESVVRPPSRCPGCGSRIRWFDNIPLLSYLVILRGRCRSCKVLISPQYPMVELAVGLIWAGSFFHLGLSWEALRGALFLSILLGIAITDGRYYIIPDEFSVGGMVLGVLLTTLALGPTLPLPFALVPGPTAGQSLWVGLALLYGEALLQCVLGAALGLGLLWGVAWAGERVFRKEAMGGGDLKMMAMVGAFLGVPGVLLTVFLGALLGSVVFGPISWRTGKLVPFGVFLAVGAAVAYGWGNQLIGWYATTFLGMGS
jgi:leader peptidase (prepilin peptidase)/N-methyltransferase